MWWHYHDGLSALYRHALNFPRLILRLLAPISLLKSLFAPLQRLQEPYKKRASFEDWAGSFVVNTIMRILGALMRVVLLVCGFIGLVVSSLLAVIVLLTWVALPLVCLASILVVVIIVT
jgi:uncharacterized membrane protein